ncbi:MAG: hypothetical protein BWY42_01557 [Candidatus Omnitrophica bacterium ADurb.Bin277]|nr:MAG: hypothetical protein BWY42_01557 [Candidatus Omnitrophica bacterium ADurb.Bin277]
MSSSKKKSLKRFMNPPQLIDKYLKNFASVDRPLHCGDLTGVDTVVVIPAYAEKDHLFLTLCSLAHNDPGRLDRTLVICVVNNKTDSGADDRENNQDTLAILDALTRKKAMPQSDASRKQAQVLDVISTSRLRIAYIDASSPGWEIPAKEGGVGMARKIGMDRALSILRNVHPRTGLIVCLDADTLVEKNYLAAVRSHFTRKIKTAVVDYAHRLPEDPATARAICAYEIYLRSYVLGLKWAGSPYAYSAIGSTMAVSAEAYLAVRGMNRRAAGEDFYFLNKLAKLAPIACIRQTRVYPSARISKRVPFGTGAAVNQYLSLGPSDFGLYDPRIFQILSNWLGLMRECPDASPQRILSCARTIHDELETFLRQRGFADVWEKIRQNVREKKDLPAHFHIWFDGFETLKLINYLTRVAYPKVEPGRALAAKYEALHLAIPDEIGQMSSPASDAQWLAVLNSLRSVT